MSGGRPLRKLLLLATVAAGLAACRAGPDRREQALGAAGRADQRVASGPVVRALRSPSDSTRIIYTPPTPLALRTAGAPGAAVITAPFGIAPPDSARRGTTAAGASGTVGARNSTVAPKPPGSTTSVTKQKPR
ncbi:MAG TPA: hypothetical protein VF832_16835 [Longimicrobiales bacterium]